jgi:hypothetical protein
MVNFCGRQGEGTLWEQFGGTINIGQGSRNHIMLGGFEGPFFYGAENSRRLFLSFPYVCPEPVLAK